MNNREDLEFEKAVKASFAYLTDQYSFKCVESSATYVKYQREDVFVSLHHGKQSYEVGLKVGLTNEEEEHGYGIGSFISVNEGDDSFKLSVVRTKECVNKVVDDLSVLLLRYASGVLDGDLRIFEKLKIHIDEYWNRIRADQIKREAKAAFSNGDYALAKKLYGSISEYLTASENKKLKIAESRSP